MSLSGSDSYDGTEATHTTGNTGPWLTTKHAVKCGDVIIAAAGNYTNQLNQGFGAVTDCPSTSGGIDGTGGIYFATVLCGGPDLESCKIDPGQNNIAVDISQASNWAVEGFKGTTDGADINNHVAAAFDADGATLGYSPVVINTYHHNAFINDVSYNSADGFGSDSNDYIAFVGDIAQNSVQSNPNNWWCVAAFDIVGPGTTDTNPGTHFLFYGNFSYNNTVGCPQGEPADGEDYMFDSFDTNAAAGQAVALDNMGWLAMHANFQLTNWNTHPTAAAIYLLNNTLYGGSQEDDNTQWTGSGISVGGTTPTNGPYWGGVTILNNISQPNLAWVGNNIGNGEPVYALGTNGNLTDVTIGGTGNENYFNGLATLCRGNYCLPSTEPYGAASWGTLADLGTNFYTDPALRNTADLVNNRVGVPNCSGFTNTSACMGYDSTTGTLTTPSAISDLQPTASGTSAKGYQLPSTTCVTSGSVYQYYPSWLKGIVYLHWNGSSITENTGLVTKPCGM